MSEFLELITKSSIYNFIGFVFGAFLWEKRKWTIIYLGILLFLFIMSIFNSNFSLILFPLLIPFVLIFFGYFVTSVLSLFGFSTLPYSYWIKVVEASVLSSAGLALLSYILYTLLKWDVFFLISIFINFIYGIWFAKDFI